MFCLICKKSEKFSIEVNESLNNNSFDSELNNNWMLEKTIKIEPKDELKTSIDCPEVVILKEEIDCKLIDIIYDSDIEVIDESNDCLKLWKKKFVTQRVSANCSQENGCQI